MGRWLSSRSFLMPGRPLVYQFERKGKKGIYLNPTQGGRKHQEGLLPRITPFPSLSAPEVKTLSSFVEL